MIGEIFYTLFIWPIHFIIELFFVLFVRIFDAPGIAVIFLSIVVNTLLLPIYLKADQWKKDENDLRLKMKKKLDSIRANFKGDEKQMITNAYYRQMGYSPVFILKASVGLLLQIPFFIAAYRFLSHTQLLNGVSFLFINNLIVPDGLIKLPFANINFLPVLMTVINIASSLIYAKNMDKKELAQLFGLSLVFLILLYNSPSGLVLYWTFNNIFSLVKNTAITYMKKPYRLLQILFAISAAVFIYMIWSGKANVERYHMLFTGMALIIGIMPFVINKIKINIKIENKSNTDAFFYSSAALLFLLISLLNPAQVLSSSVYDFESPWLFFFRALLQGISFLILIPLFIKALCPASAKSALAFIWSFIALNAVICYFALSAYYGVMDRNFTLDNTDRLLHAFPFWVNVIVPLFAAGFIALFVYIKKIKILTVLFQAACAAVFLLICIDLVKLQIGYIEVKKLRGNDNYSAAEIPVYFPLSKTQPNVFIVFMDRAQSAAFFDALAYWYGLFNALDGFVFYPDTISFGNSTVLGVPPMLGGYNYTPDKINERKNELLVDKVNEAIKTMPRLFGQAGFNVTITDPVIANMQSVPDISIFEGMPNVTARLLSGKLSDRYRAEFPVAGDEGVRSFDFDILFRYGIFRASFPALRYGIYYKGQWWREAAYNSYGRAVGEFSSLYYLPDICAVKEDEKPTLNILMNSITHEGGFYNDDFFPQNTAVEYAEPGIGPFRSKEQAEYLHVLMAGITQLAKWFDYLKEECIYDNTRIIIVSDHGGSYRYEDTSGMEGYMPLFMIKDFNAQGPLVVSDELMTNADTPYKAAQGLVDMESADKSFTVFSGVSSQPLRHGPYQFNLDGKRELVGKDVLSRESWRDWERD